METFQAFYYLLSFYLPTTEPYTNNTLSTRIWSHSSIPIGTNTTTNNNHSPIIHHPKHYTLAYESQTTLITLTTFHTSTRLNQLISSLYPSIYSHTIATIEQAWLTHVNRTRSHVHGFIHGNSSTAKSFNRSHNIECTQTKPFRNLNLQSESTHRLTAISSTTRTQNQSNRTWSNQ